MNRALCSLLSTALLVACSHAPQPAAVGASGKVHIEAPVDVLSYRVSIKPDVTTGYLEGHETVKFTRGSKDRIVFSSNDLEIVSASLNDVPTSPEKTDDGIAFPFADTANGDELTLTVHFRGTPTRGYDVINNSIVTGYFACDWMICMQDNFGDKATMSLEILLPKKMETVGPGVLVSSGQISSGEYRALWQSDREYSAYLYAFAVGDFVIAKDKVGNTTLRYVSANASEEQLLALFAPTADMLNFFVEKAGTDLPGDTYTQIYVPGQAAQEAVSHATIGMEMLAPILKNPQEDWVIAHELAHQWWGNSITCTELSEFWLNEGVTVFMVAAWKEHRWGRAAYERELNLLRRRWQKAKDADMDVPLTFKGEYPDLATRRAIQYSKGALFMDALRQKLGDEVFWQGLRRYTTNNSGASVTSRDFQSAFEVASGEDLAEILAEWVY